MPKIFITGSNGFVGKSVVKLLSAYNFTNYSRFLNTKINDEIAVIHTAGLAHNKHDDKLFEKYKKANTDLTIKIFDSFLKSNAKTFIFFSSSKVSGLKNGFLVENKLSDQLNVYSKSKYLAERYILKNTYPNKKIYIIRPSLIVGDNLKGNLKILKIISCKSIPWIFEGLNNSISILDMRNLSYVLEKFIEDKIPSGIYNLANDNPLKVNELFMAMKMKRNKKYYGYNISPYFLKQLFDFGGFFKLPMLNSNTFKKLSENSKVSTKKLKKTVGNLPFNNSQTIKRYL